MTKHSRSRRVLTFASSVAVIVASAWAHAQPPVDAEPVVPPLKELDLEIRILTDDGELRAVPAISVEELLRKTALEDGQRDVPQPPRGRFFETTEITGSVGASLVDLKAVCRVEITKVDDDDEAVWAPIALRFDNAFLSPTVDHVGEGRFHLLKQGDGFVGWVHGIPGSKHTITLAAKIPLKRNGGETSLSFVAPNSPTRLQLEVPGDSLTFRSGGASDILEVNPSDGGSQVDLFTNIDGGILLAWRSQNMVEKLTEASGRIIYDVEGNRVQADAELSVRRRGEALGTFEVRLPLGMEYVSSESQGFRVSVNPPQAGEPQTVVVTSTDGPTTGWMTVKFHCTTTLASADGMRTLDAAGFQVLGAKRQWGSVEVAVDSNQSVTWRPGGSVYRDPQLSDSLRDAKQSRNKTVARFQYDVQPYRLAAELQRKQDRVRVEPISYTVRVEESLARLNASLKYQLPVAGRESVEILMPGWTVERVLPPAVVNGDFVVADNRLVVPLDSNASEFELQIIASQELADSDSVSISLPRPVEGETSPAKVVIDPADNVALSPVQDSIEALVLDVEPEAPNDLALRYKEDVAGQANRTAVFVADKRVLPLAVEAAVETAITVGSTDLSVDQTFSLAIQHERVREIDFYVPIGAEIVFEVAEDGSVLEQTDVPEDEAGGEPLNGTHKRVRLDLGEERYGEWNLTATTTIQRTVAGADAPLDVALVQPAEAETLTVIANRLHVIPGDGHAAAVVGDAWTTDSDVLADDDLEGELRVQTDSPGLTVALRVSEARRRLTATAVSRAWLQTWVTPTDRRNRACYRVATTQDEVRLRLPPGVELEGAEIDGRAAELVDNEDGTLLVSLTAAAPSSEYTLEVWYFMEPAQHGLTMTLPEIEGVARIDRVYWQVVLPKNRHLLWASSAVTPELVWENQDLYWGRRGRLEQRELELLLNAKHRDADKLPDHTNRYLFTSTGSVPTVELVTAHRLVTMLVVSMAILGAAFFLINSSQVHPGALLAAAVLVGAAAITFPATAVLAAQAGAVGIAAAVVYPILRRFLGVERRVQPMTHDSTHFPAESPSAPTSLRKTEGSSRAATSTGATQPYPAPPTA